MKKTSIKASKERKTSKCPAENVARATILILAAQVYHKCVPDYVISEVRGKTGLSDADCRKIRDVIQGEALPQIGGCYPHVSRETVARVSDIDIMVHGTTYEGWFTTPLSDFWKQYGKDGQRRG